MRKTLWALAAVFGLALLLRYPTVAIPLERDEGGYAYIAQRWALGEVPYKGSFDQKLPGIYLAYRFLGSSPSAIHWGAGIYGLGTLALLLLLGRRLFSLEAGAAAAALCAFISIDPSLAGNAANTEIFMILPMVGALLAALIAAERDSPAWAFLTGALAAMAVMFKQTAVTDLVFYFYLLRRTPKRLAALAGAAAVVLPVLAYFSAAGAWREFYDCTIGYNLAYAERSPWGAYPARFWASFAGTLSAFWPVYLFAAWGAWKCCVERRWLVPAWLIVSFLGVAAGGRFRNHYFIQAAPPLALLAAAGLPKLGRAKAALALCVLLNGVLASSWYYLPGSPEAKCRRIYGYNPFPESVPVARYISSHSSPEDSVFVFGSEPQIYFYSGRKSASRYIYVYPLFTPFSGTRERQRSAMAEIRSNTPKFIVTVSARTSFLASPGSPLDIYADLKELLASGYKEAGAIRIGPDGGYLWTTGESSWPKSLTVWERSRKSS